MNCSRFLLLILFVTSFDVVAQVRVNQDKFSPFSIEEPVSPKIGLALSGGGARGIFQIGVLKALEEHHIPIHLIVGTSMGSVVGGLYANGYSANELEQLALTLDWNSLLNLTTGVKREQIFLDQKNLEDKTLITLELDNWKPKIPNAVSDGQKLTTELNKLTFNGIYYPDSSFDDMAIPFRSVAVNLADGRRVVFENGSLVEAIRASMSIPLLFEPYEKNAMRLVDGGVISNIPVDIAVQENCDLIIAVNSTGKLQPIEEINAPWQTVDQVLSIMMKLANQVQLRQSDVTINLTLDDYQSFDFSNLDTLIKNGYEQTQLQIGYIDTLIDFYSKHNGRDVYEIVYKGKNQLLDSAIAEIKLPENSQIIMRKLYNSGWVQSTSLSGVDDHTTLTVKDYPIIESISFHGINLLPTSEVRRLFYDLLGKPYSYFDGREKFRNLIKRYRQKGFTLADIEKFEFNDTTHHLDVYMDEGIVRSILVEGQKISKDITIFRELPIAQNQILSSDRLDNALENLTTTNLFNQVNINQRKDETGNQLIVNVNEKSSVLLRTGFNASETYHTQFFVDLRNENLFGSGSKIGISTFGGDRNLTSRIEFRSNRILNSFFTFQSTFAYEGINLTINDYTLSKNFSTGSEQNEKRTEIGTIFREHIYGKLAVGRQYAKFGEISLSLQRRLSRQSAATGFNNQDSTRFTKESNYLTNLKLESIFDTRDHLTIPKKGSFIRFLYENSATALGSGLDYNKLFISMETTVPFLPLVTMTPKFEYGTSDQAMPLSESFLRGGSRSFYGFRENDLIGKQVIMSHIGLDWNTPTTFIFDVILHARYDIGNVWNGQKTIKLSDMIQGIGGGITLTTPLGPLTFALGRYFELSKVASFSPVIGWGPMTYYISIGNSFF